MKKFMTLMFVFSVSMGLGINPASAKEEKAIAKIPYDPCEGVGTSTFMQGFPSLATFKKYYPDILAKGNSPKPPFYGKRYFNLACGGTALTGEIKITKNNQVSIETCGDLATQTEEEACSTDFKGNYKDLYGKGNGYIFREGKIFIVEGKQVTVTRLYSGD